MLTMMMGHSGFCQKLNTGWQDELTVELKEFLNCENTTANGVNACNPFIGKTLKTVYEIDDFYAKEAGRYMLVSEIENHLEKSGKWTLLGKAYDQKALAEAQKRANAKNAVVAIYTNDEDLGLVSYILPGELKQSGSWGFEVPNSASFIISEPEKSYVNKGLSYGFKRNLIKDVRIYARNY
jgi:hypothetical protein